MTIWDCRTHVRMTSMTSSVERTDLDFKISVALLHPLHDLKVNVTVLEVLCKVLRLSLKDLIFFQTLW